MNNFEFDQSRLDTLREMSSIAAGNAATSLAALLGIRVNITVPAIRMESIVKVPEFWGGRENKVVALHFSLKNEIRGDMMLLLSSSDSLKLVNRLINSDIDKIEDLNEIGLSALKELGNILIGTYIRALCKGMQLRIAYSIPGFAFDMVGSVLDGIVSKSSYKTNYVMIIEHTFIIENDIYGIRQLFILEPEFLDIMLEKSYV